jgi:hypothetical protein
MFDNIKELLLNTPEKYWLIIGNYHIHKSFWGIISLILGTFSLSHKFLKKKYRIIFAIFFLLIGTTALTLSIIGQKYTHGKYKLELWEKYARQK